MTNSDTCRHFEFCSYSRHMSCVYSPFFKAVSKHPCDDRPCKNGGYCMQVGSTYKCYCRSGYTGPDCSLGKSPPPLPSQRKPSKSPWTYCSFTRIKTSEFSVLSLLWFSFVIATSAIISNQCSGGTDLLPHPTYCQLYYNCSARTGNIPARPQEQYLDECPYPHLFSTATSRCEPFYRVECGQRQVLVDYCKMLQLYYCKI